MTTDSRLLTPDARRTANRLLDLLERERIAEGTTGTVPPVLGPGEVDRKPALIEQAKGALMLHYGVDSHQAFAVLVGWARMSHTPVHTIAHTLLRGICEGSPQTEVRQRRLTRWLEAQLRDSDLGHAQLRTQMRPEATGTRDSALGLSAVQGSVGTRLTQLASLHPVGIGNSPAEG